MLIFRSTPVNLTISGCRCARNGATGSWWMLLKTQFLVYSPRRRLRTVSVPGWSKDINNLLPPPPPPPVQSWVFTTFSGHSVWWWSFGKCRLRWSFGHCVCTLEHATLWRPDYVFDLQIEGILTRLDNFKAWWLRLVWRLAWALGRTLYDLMLQLILCIMYKRQKHTRVQC